MKGTDGPVPLDWNLYTQTYFGLWGNPKREEWSIDRVLQRVSSSTSASHQARVGLVPDLPRFDVPAFQFAIDLHRYPVTLDRQFSPEEMDLEANDYLLLSLGKQTAFGSQAPHADEIRANVESHPERFHVIDRFTLPSGETILLYKCVR